MIIPVLDIKNGNAVSGKSGMRKTYKPLKTVFSGSSDPVKIVGALKDAGARRMYIADLDAIEGEGSNLQLVKQVNEVLPVMLDAGAGDVNSVEKVLKVADKVIIATETLRSLEDLDEIFKLPKKSLVLSVDIKNNHVLSKHTKLDLNDLMDKIADLNPKETILLDISRVGTEKGVDKKLISKLSNAKTSIILGGGIRDEDIEMLSSLGVEKFLVGSALHGGKIRHEFD